VKTLVASAFWRFQKNSDDLQKRVETGVKNADFLVLAHTRVKKWQSSNLTSKCSIKSDSKKGTKWVQFRPFFTMSAAVQVLFMALQWVAGLLCWRW